MHRSDSYELQTLAPKDDVEYSELIQSIGSPSVLGYHSTVYRDLLTTILDAEPLYFGVRHNGNLVGALPGFIKTGPFGRVYNSLPFFGPNAGALAHPDHAAAVHRLLLTKVREISREEEALSATVYTPFLQTDFGWYDDILGADATVERETLYIDLRKGLRWNSSIRYDLRKADQFGMRIATDPEDVPVQTIYDLYASAYASRGIPLKPYECVQYLTTEGVRRGVSRLRLAYLDDELIGGLLTIRGPHTVSYYMPFQKEEFRSTQVGSKLIAVAMEQAAAEGKTHWNWEASPRRDSGVYRFKQKWGSSPSSYRLYNCTRHSMSFLRELPRDRLASEYRHFYVFPFDQLDRGA